MEEKFDQFDLNRDLLKEIVEKIKEKNFDLREVKILLLDETEKKYKILISTLPEEEGNYSD